MQIRNAERQWESVNILQTGGLEKRRQFIRLEEIGNGVRQVLIGIAISRNPPTQSGYDRA